MTPTPLTTVHYDVLNAVVIKQMADAGTLSEATGLGTADVEGALAELADDGLVLKVGATAVPVEGAADVLAGVAADRYAAVRTDPEVLGQVDRFEEVNRQLLAAMTSWQTVTVGGRQIPNDHADEAYDDKVVARVDRLVGRLSPLLDALTAYDPRFGRYRERFDVALDAVDTGQREFVSSPLHDSVHTVWFEFHEDLLRTLGRRRTE
jgi:hypothetical protein